MCQDETLSIQDPIKQPAAADGRFAGAIAKQLCALIGTDRFDLWFSDRDSIRYSGPDSDGSVLNVASLVRVGATSQFSLQRIQNAFGKDIRSVVDRVCGPHIGIEYRLLESNVLPEVLSDVESAQSPIAKSPIAKLDGQSEPNGTPTIRMDRSHSQTSSPAQRRPSLSSFWFGEGNRLLKAGVDQLFEHPGQFSPFFVYGPAGSGKTQLLESITSDFRRRLRKKRCVFLSAEQFTSQFVGSLRGGSGHPMFRRKYRDLDLLAIDDIQFFAGKRATLGEFQHTIDNLIRMGKQVIVSSDRPPIELGELGNDIVARLSGGLTCPVRYPDFEGRMQIVQNLCSQRKLKLSTSVLRLVCDQLARDVRRLSGAINRLHAYSVSFDEKITPEFAQKVLVDLFSLSGPNCTSMVTVEQAVCDFCGVKPAELRSSSRQKRISSARMLAMYLSRQYTGSAFSEIGDYFGGRSHSTVIAAERKVIGWLENDEGISLPHAKYSAKEVVRRLESNLRIG